jgi:hypothetical protein
MLISKNSFGSLTTSRGIIGDSCELRYFESGSDLKIATLSFAPVPRFKEIFQASFLGEYVNLGISSTCDLRFVNAK